MSQSVRRLLAVLVLVLVLGGGVFVWVGQTVRGPRVQAYQPVSQPITATLLVTGRLAPPASVDLGAQVQSTVVEVFADEGQVVEAGTLLATLADDEAVAKLADAEAQVAEASARLARVRGVGRKVASEKVEQARIQLEDAETSFARSSVVYRSGGTTEAAHDAARKEVNTARSQLVAAQLEAGASSAGGADTATAVAALARAQAGVELARAGLERTRLRAPTSGRLLQRRVEAGQVVRPGDALFRLASEGRLEVHVTPDEFHLGSLEVGQEARVRVGAFPERPIRAVVDRIAPQIDPARGTVEVRLSLADEVDTMPLRPDMSATVEVVLGHRDDAMVLPTWLVRDLGTRSPWVLVAEDGKAVHRPVSLGLIGEKTVEIATGLEPDDLVLAVDAKLEPDDPVRTRSPQPALP